MSTQNQEIQAAYDTLLKGLAGLGYSQDDLRAQLCETAQSGVRQIIDTLEYQYRKTHDLEVLPKEIWATLRGGAYLTYAAYCEELAAEIKASAHDPNVRF